MHPRLPRRDRRHPVIPRNTRRAVHGLRIEASRLCFNKVSTKLWLSAVGIPNTPYVFLSDNSQASQASALQAMRNWGSVFVKAASQGSSVGCYKVDDLAKLPDAINEAFKYSRQVLVEKNVHPRELEVAVYQYGDQVIATNPGEIKTDKSTFYSWEEKYDGSSKAETVVEAELSDEQKEQIRSWPSRHLTSSSSAISRGSTSSSAPTARSSSMRSTPSPA